MPDPTNPTPDPSAATALTLEQAKAQFIHLWGATSASWGINRTMAQMHALLLVSAEALSTEDLMTQLQISRGNASMTVRELLDWGLVYKALKPGERREYFVAEKDMLQVTRCIIRERKRRELDAMKRSLDQLAALPGDPTEPGYREFHRVLGDIQQLADSADTVLTGVMKAEKTWLIDKLLRMFT
ncbi:GbsR/MarR family transcriptional regulator [Hymenobacter jeollabukensis]|uniref:GbsR/MarR family transcriptional regulator n=1 Tax=Hymenobacter jeollabukensis TaxID=2025313 RepID=UPI001FE9AC65|nr:MarR family transcriptional regulator [Hymenobacter jeollabukensis]